MKTMEKKKYLKFYNECMKSGHIPFKSSAGNVNGLCGNFGDKVMDIFRPTGKDCITYNVCPGGYWARDEWERQAIDFGPTRQNIVLFLAAMNGEL